MGAEDYQVVVQLTSTQTVEAASSLLRRVGFTEDACEIKVPRTTSSVKEEPLYFLEAQITEGANNVQLSVRHAVCQPQEADQALAEILWAIRPVAAEYWFVDNGVRVDRLGCDTIEEFRDQLKALVDPKRQLWLTDFGGTLKKMRCRDAYDEHLGRVREQAR